VTRAGGVETAFDAFFQHRRIETLEIGALAALDVD
jgi:hypothetical protein